MSMKRCANGHFYDSDVHQQCPYCGGANVDAEKTMPLTGAANVGFGATQDLDADRTIPMSQSDIQFDAGQGMNPDVIMPTNQPADSPFFTAPQSIPPTMPLSPLSPGNDYMHSSSVKSTVGMDAEQMNRRMNVFGDDDDQKTIGIMMKDRGFDPVVGWLVCVEGPSRGQDYKIRSERNFIGRGSDMDIVLAEDMSVSRDSHAIISYNPKNRGFRLIPGDGHGLVYLNDDEVLMPTELKTGDIIEIGQTKLRFVPFCDGSFQW